jgi:hypothetical protein
MPGMKKVFDFGRFIVRQPKGGGCVALLGAALLLVAGCSKSNTPPPTPPPASDVTNTPTASTGAAPITYAPAMGATNASDTQTEVQTLNKALLGWMIKNRRHPQDFAEFASTANIQIPTPPPGKKYTLNQRGFITLVDNSTQ